MCKICFCLIHFRKRFQSVSRPNEFLGTTRVGGNKKGIFTRQRQPKRVAYVLRERYRNLPSLLKETERRSLYDPLYVDGQEGYSVKFVEV